MGLRRRLGHRVFQGSMRLLIRLRERYRHLPVPALAIPGDVTEALAVRGGELVESRGLAARVQPGRVFENPASYEDLFCRGGEPLPCVLPADHLAPDGWLTHAGYYPAYFNLYRRCSEGLASVRMLEIGVRTGYQCAVFARACGRRAPSLFVGIDPNLYVREGMLLASRTCRALKEELPRFEYAFIEGYSWENIVQRSAECSGPFDLVHIDGDHSLAGKLVDLAFARRLCAPGGLVLVDDFDHHTAVSEAVRRAFACGWYTEFLYLPTLRGLAVIKP